MGLTYYVIKINHDTTTDKENISIKSFSNLNLATIEYHTYARDCRSNEKIDRYHVEVINRFGHREINETWERQAPQPTPSV